MRGASKSTSLGTVAALTMGVREVYPREANLTLGWKRCRIGMFWSLIGLSDSDNADCIAETVPYLASPDRLAIGISNGVAHPGQTGNRFVGLMSAPASITVGYNSTDAYWQPLRNNALHRAIGDGTTLASTAISGSLSNRCIHKAPSGADNFAAYFGVDIELTATGATIGVQTNGAIASPYGITDMSKPALLRYMYDQAISGLGAVTGGWWLTGDPVNMRHLSIRFPHTANRLRIHALEVKQLG